MPQAKQLRIKFPEVHGPPGSPKPLQPNLPLQPHRPFTLTPKRSRVSRECPKHKSYPPTPFYCPATQLENHGQVPDNCRTIAGQLLPPPSPSPSTMATLLPDIIKSADTCPGPFSSSHFIPVPSMLHFGQIFSPLFSWLTIPVPGLCRSGVHQRPSPKGVLVSAAR